MAAGGMVRRVGKGFPKSQAKSKRKTGRSGFRVARPIWEKPGISPRYEPRTTGSPGAAGGTGSGAVVGAGGEVGVCALAGGDAGVEGDVGVLAGVVAVRGFSGFALATALTGAGT